MNIIPETCCAH